MENKKYFFSWKNIRWIIIEIFKMYSEKEQSFFCKMKIESGIAFIIFAWGLIHFMKLNVEKIKVEELAIWCGILIPFIIYTVWKIQQGKNIEK